MADKEVLQRGTVPTTNSKGVRVSERSMTDEDRPGSTRVSLGSGLADNSAAALAGRKQQLDDAIAKQGMKRGGKVSKFAKGGSIDGVAQRGKTVGKVITMKRGAQAAKIK